MDGVGWRKRQKSGKPVPSLPIRSASYSPHRSFHLHCSCLFFPRPLNWISPEPSDFKRSFMEAWKMIVCELFLLRVAKVCTNAGSKHHTHSPMTTRRSTNLAEYLYPCTSTLYLPSNSFVSLSLCNMTESSRVSVRGGSRLSLEKRAEKNRKWE